MAQQYPLPNSSIDRKRVVNHRDRVRESTDRRLSQGFRRISVLVHEDDVEKTKAYATKSRLKKMKELGIV